MACKQLHPKDFNVPLENDERNDLLRYVSKRNKKQEKNMRPRSSEEPPSNFSFLSGIHPDLDEALCEIISPSTSSWQKREEIQHLSSEKPKYTYTSKRTQSYTSPRNIGGRRNFFSTDDKSKENIMVDEFVMPCPPEREYDHSFPRSTTFRQFGSKNIGKVDSRPSSTPLEITCARQLDMNESLDGSLPFSVDGIEKAKRRIKSQAAKIRDLEAKLEQATKNNPPESYYIEDGDNKTTKNVISPEERLQAHLERKRLDNKYKEGTGKWAAPPPVKSTNLTSKVKPKEKLVERLVTNPKQRRRQDEVNKKMNRNMKKLEKESYNVDNGLGLENDDELDEYSGIDHSTNNKKEDNPKMTQSLMERLNMSVMERRTLDTHQDHMPNDLRRALQGHNMHKKSWIMSKEYGPSTAGDNIDLDDDIGRAICCYTCNSNIDCEEDVDNPGTYYCQNCWEDYDCNESKQGKVIQNAQNEMHDEENSSPPSLKEGQESMLEIRGNEQLYDEALWIIHDNPKLDSTISWSGSNKTKCLVETKDPERKHCVRFLLGQIDYCGAVINSGIRHGHHIQDIDRGTQCIRISNVDGFVIDHNKVETRLAKNKSIYEFKVNAEDAIVLTGKESQMRIHEFFHGCKGAVDAILAPQCSPGGWYPQREASSSRRKIAPQFRSNGVGYIRLGDDMGNNGLAFLSSDSCRSFFSTPDAVETESGYIINNRLKSNASFATQNSKSSLRRKSRKAPPAKRPSKICDFSDDDHEDEIDGGFSSAENDENDDEYDERKLDAATILKELNNLEVAKVVKWREKADLLLDLGKAIKKPKGRGTCPNALNYIQDVISAKNGNINVLRNALVVVENIGHVMKLELVNHVTWKTILIEMLKMLKNKQVANTTNELLQKLHGTCFSLANPIVAVSHVLGMGKTTSTKASHRRSSSSMKKHRHHSQSSSNQSNSAATKANNVEIIEWLASTIEVERGMMGPAIDPMLDMNDLSQIATFFTIHESHRDARCRKNALDGMLHTILYGIEKLEMRKSEALDLCSDVKTANPRSWTRLMKSVNTALKNTRT
jgi:hypothetical protein